MPKATSLLEPLLALDSASHTDASVIQMSKTWLIVGFVIAAGLMGIATTATLLFMILQNRVGPRNDLSASSEGAGNQIRIDRMDGGLVQETNLPRVVPEVPPLAESKNAAKSKGSVDPFDDIISKGNILLLPKHDGGVFSSDRGGHQLCKIKVKRPADCEMALFTAETLLDGQPRFFLEPQTPQSDRTSIWIAKSRAKNTVTEIIDEEEIGTFTLKDQILTFEWKHDAPDRASPFGLAYCELDLNVGSEKIRCSLAQPIHKPTERVSFKIRNGWLPVEIPVRTLASDQSLRFDIEVRIDDWSEVKTNIAAKDKLTFQIPGSAQSDGSSEKIDAAGKFSVSTGKRGTSSEKITNTAPNSNVDLEIDFEPPRANRDSKLRYAAFIYVDTIKASSNLFDGFKQERVDRIDESMKNGVIFSDFADMKKKGHDDLNNLRKEIPNARTALKRLETLTTELFSAKERSELLEDLQKQKVQLAKLEEKAGRVAAVMLWTEAAESRLRTIEERLEIRFRFYLEFEQGRIVLVETIPPPSKPKVSSIIKPPTSSPATIKDDRVAP